LFTVFVNSLTPLDGRPALADAASGVSSAAVVAALLLLLAICRVLFYSRCNRVAAYMCMY